MPLPVISPLLAALLGGDAPATEQVSRQAQQAIPVSVCTAEQQKVASREHMAKLHERTGTYDFGAKHRLPKETVLESKWEHLKVRATAQLKELEMAELKCCGRRHQQAKVEANLQEKASEVPMSQHAPD